MCDGDTGCDARGDGVCHVARREGPGRADLGGVVVSTLRLARAGAACVIRRRRERGRGWRGGAELAAVVGFVAWAGRGRTACHYLIRLRA